jgi:hypothetical protein
MWDINGKHADKRLTVGELIEELSKYPADARLGYFSINAHLRGDPTWIDGIFGVELCDDEKTVAIIGDMH